MTVSALHLAGVAFFFLTVILPGQAAQAHDLGRDVSWQAGFLHPLTGPDHLIAMLGVGMVSVVLGGRAIWAVPATFVKALPIGAAIGDDGWRIAHVEAGVALSVVLLGTGLVEPGVTRWRSIIFGGIACFGLCHGYVHGVEMPRPASPLAFAVGFMSASVILHVCGLFAAEMLFDRSPDFVAHRAIGGAMIGAGGYFLFGVPG